MTYAQKLKDPRWQRRRLEVFSQADFKCQICKSGVDELAVHHVNYKKGAEPWDYQVINEQLVCLCGRCHRSLEKNIIPRMRILATKLRPEIMSKLLIRLEIAIDEVANKSVDGRQPYVAEILENAVAEDTAACVIGQLDAQGVFDGDQILYRIDVINHLKHGLLGGLILEGRHE